MPHNLRFGDSPNPAANTVITAFRENLGGGVGGSAGSALAFASSLASSQPGISKAQFDALLQEAGFKSTPLLFDTFRQLASPSGNAPKSAEDVTSPEPEGPGRFQATRPGDLVGADNLRFGA